LIHILRSYTTTVLSFIDISLSIKEEVRLQDIALFISLELFPVKSLDQNYLPLCTSSGHLLELCKVALVSLHSLVGAVLTKQCGLTDRVFPLYPKQTCVGYIHPRKQKADKDCFNNENKDFILLYTSVAIR